MQGRHVRPCKQPTIPRNTRQIHKSYSLVYEALFLAGLNPGRWGLLGAPTYPMLRDVTLRTIFEVLVAEDIRYEHNRTENTHGRAGPRPAMPLAGHGLRYPIISDRVYLMRASGILTRRPSAWAERAALRLLERTAIGTLLIENGDEIRESARTGQGLALVHPDAAPPDGVAVVRGAWPDMSPGGADAVAKRRDLWRFEVVGASIAEARFDLAAMRRARAFRPRPKMGIRG